MTAQPTLIISLTNRHTAMVSIFSPTRGVIKFVSPNVPDLKVKLMKVNLILDSYGDLVTNPNATLENSNVIETMKIKVCKQMAEFTPEGLTVEFNGNQTTIARPSIFFYEKDWETFVNILEL